MSQFETRKLMRVLAMKKYDFDLSTICLSSYSLTVPDVFMMAAGQGNSALVQDMLDHYSLDLNSEHYSRGFVGAAVAGNVEIVRLLREYIDLNETIDRAMSAAAYQGRIDVFVYLWSEHTQSDLPYKLLWVLLEKVKHRHEQTGTEHHAFHRLNNALLIHQIIEMYHETTYSEPGITREHPTYLSSLPSELLVPIARYVTFGNIHLPDGERLGSVSLEHFDIDSQINETEEISETTIYDRLLPTNADDSCTGHCGLM